MGLHICLYAGIAIDSVYRNCFVLHPNCRATIGLLAVNCIYMDITLLLAQIWGPILMAIGLGFFMSRAYYMKVYRDLEKAPFAVLFFGMFAMAAGIAQVLAHNVWGNLPQSLVSLLGWGLLLKGVICVVLPKLADRGGDWALDARIVPAAGGIALLLGVYLTWISYFV